MGRRSLLSDAEVAIRLAGVPSWVRAGPTIERTWTFGDFPEALAFINRVGALAEEMNHHPDIENSWNRVTLRLTTHDRGGLTALDFELARRVDAISGPGEKP
jgi:4a-hydroxytetrahydrobiopterin dehydratase